MVVITPQFKIILKTRSGVYYRVPAVESIKVHTSRKPEADTAVIRLPSMRGLGFDTFSKGDELHIWFGHAEDERGLSRVFSGTVVKLGPQLPVTLQAKDRWWLIKKAWYNDREGKLTDAGLNAIARELFANPGEGGEALEGVELITCSAYDPVVYHGEFPLGNRPYGELFGELLKHGWDLFMLPGENKLWFGPRDNLPIAYPVEYPVPVFRSGLNIIDNDLDYRDKSGLRKVEVRASDKQRESEQPDAVYPELDGNGDPAGPAPEGWDRYGDTKKFEIPGLDKSIPAGRPGSAAWYAKLLYTVHSKQGLSGSLKTFGLGWYHHWMRCRLDISIAGLKRDRHCYPAAIDYNFSAVDGFRMEVHFAGEGGSPA